MHPNIAQPLVIVCLLTAVLTASAVSGQGAPARDGYLVTSDSARIHYRVVGNAPDTIIALHGGPGGDLNGIVDDFAPPHTLRHTVIFYDQRGGGRSELPTDTTRLFVARQIAELDDLRLHFGLAKASLAAHSFGPLLAASYALAHPTAVRRMVFFGPVSPRRDSMWVRMNRTLRARLDSAQVRRGTVLNRQRADSTADVVAACREYWGIYLLPRLAEPARTRSLLKLDLCAESVITMLYSTRITNRVVLGSFGNWDLREQLRHLDVPTLVIHGEEDAMPMDMVEEWTTFLPHSELIRVPRAARFPYVERAEIVWPAVERFLAQKDR